MSERSDHECADNNILLYTVHKHPVANFDSGEFYWTLLEFHYVNEKP